MRKSAWTGAGGVIAAFLGSLCCIGPVLFISLGLSAGFATLFEPLRPLFGVLMLVLFGIGFYTVYGKRRFAATSGDSVESCEMQATRREQAVLWSALILAAALWFFPTWSKLFL